MASNACRRHRVVRRAAFDWRTLLVTCSTPVGVIESFARDYQGPFADGETHTGERDHHAECVGADSATGGTQDGAAIGYPCNALAGESGAGEHGDTGVR